MLYRTGLTPLTFPFQLVVWMWILNTQVWGSEFVPGLAPLSFMLPYVRHNNTCYDLKRVTLAVFSGVAEIYVLEDWWCGVIILFGMYFCSRISMIFCLVGSFIGTMYGFVVGVDLDIIFLGLYGYNSSLCAIALGGFFLVVSGWRMLTFVVLFSVLAAVVNGATAAFFKPFGLAILTWPFAFATWVGVLASVKRPFIKNVELDVLSTPEDHRKIYGIRPNNSIVPATTTVVFLENSTRQMQRNSGPPP